MSLMKYGLAGALAILGALAPAHAALYNAGSDPAAFPFADIFSKSVTAPVVVDFSLTSLSKVNSSFLVEGSGFTGNYELFKADGTNLVTLPLAIVPPLPPFPGSPPFPGLETTGFTSTLPTGSYYFEFVVTSGSVSGDFFTGVVATKSVSAVPETTTWAMMLMGFLGVGFVAYRRKVSGSNIRFA